MASHEDIRLLIIDPQNDFCNPAGSLFVPGADKDMDRLASFVSTNHRKFTEIHLTLDTHRKVDISHPIWWTGKDGKHPTPFTMITSDDLRKGVWRTTIPGLHQKSLGYLVELETRARYPHVIWPEHCLIGTEGHAIQKNLFDALAQWEARFAQVDYVTKGSNPYTEHFSAIRAEVEDPMDPTTQLNMSLMQGLEKADRVYVTGQALSHCVLSTVRDIVDSFSHPDFVKKLVLLTDTSSKVPDPPGTTLFTDATNKFLNDMVSRGMQLATSDTIVL